MKHPRAVAVAIILTFLVTAIAVIFLLNILGGEKEIRKSPEHRYGIEDPQFLRTMGVLLGPALVEGNRVETLLNGDQIFPAMLKAIEGAQKTITFETYIYWSGTVGKSFAEALARKAKSGVKVHVLLDWVGSAKMDEALTKDLEASGVIVKKYHPPHWYTLNKMNNRTHRKLLVIDGKVGFTGGVGIGDKWSGNAQDPEHWRDTHYRIEGPVVAQFQAAFLDNWTKLTGEVLHTAEYFPPLEAAGTQLAQMFKSSVEGGAESMHLMYLLSVAAAKQTIDLSMAYFVPDDVAHETLVAALKRGVKVRLLLPGPNIDSSVVRRASRAAWGPLLEAGAEIFEYQPTMFHVKVLVVDGIWSSVGSTNFDVRSFRLNDEANLNVFDRDFAARQLADMEADLKKAKKVTHAEWKNRAWTEKLWERTVASLSPQL